MKYTCKPFTSLRQMLVSHKKRDGVIYVKMTKEELAKYQKERRT